MTLHSLSPLELCNKNRNTFFLPGSFASPAVNVSFFGKIHFQKTLPSETTFGKMARNERLHELVTRDRTSTEKGAMRRRKWMRGLGGKEVYTVATCHTDGIRKLLAIDSHLRWILDRWSVVERKFILPRVAVEKLFTNLLGMVAVARNLVDAICFRDLLRQSGQKAVVWLMYTILQMAEHRIKLRRLECFFRSTRKTQYQFWCQQGRATSALYFSRDVCLHRNCFH